MLPVRGLGTVGIVSDLNPYDLPPNALSAGVNVRFENSKITRGPVVRRVHEYSDSFAPAFLFSIPPIGSAYTGLVAVSRDMATIRQTIGPAETDLSPLNFAGVDLDLPFSHTFLGGVSYLNRRSHVPLYRRASDERYAPLPGWDPTHRAAVLRSYKDFLVALNVQKGAVELPTLVKWSDLAYYGDVPATWDPASTEHSAGETTLSEMKDEIRDGLSLRDSFIIYGASEVWGMDYIGGNFLFRFRKLYDNVGVINANCVVQVDGLHYVFDKDDIYVHDGASKRSVIHGKDKDFVFRSLNYDRAHLCFVNHDPRLSEIYFCYVSGDRFAGTPGARTGCNRAAVYNYRLDNWTFYDLPNVTSGCLASVSSALSYSDLLSTPYDAVGGSYLSSEDDKDLHALFAGQKEPAMGLTRNRIYGLDLATDGRLAKPIDHEATRPAFVERVGIDLDELGASLTTYKAMQAIYPQIGLRGDTSTVQFQFGSSDIVGQDPEWTDLTPYNPRTEHKVDIRTAGRYLAYRLYFDGPGDFMLSGFDLKVTVRGRR